MIFDNAKTFATEAECKKNADYANTSLVEGYREIFDVRVNAKQGDEFSGEVADIINAPENKALLFVPIAAASITVEDEDDNEHEETLYRFNVVDQSTKEDNDSENLLSRYDRVKKQLSNADALEGSIDFTFQLPQSEEDLAVLCDIKLSLSEVYNKLNHD